MSRLVRPWAHRARARILSLALLLAPLALHGNAGAAPAQVDTVGFTSVILHPEHPCQGDSLILYVRGFEATPCWVFLGVEGGMGEKIIIRTQVNQGIQCLIEPAVFYAVPVPLGRFAAGNHRLEITRETILVAPDGSRDSLSEASFLDFQVTLDCPTIPTLPWQELPFVNRIGTDPSPVCPDRPTSLLVAGAFRDGCGRLVGSEVLDPEHVSITLAPYPPRPTACPTVLRPWSVTLPLGLFEPGKQRTEILLTVLGTSASWPPIPTQRYRGVFEFDVPVSCNPTPGPLPYVDLIRILPQSPCRSEQKICPSDSILVLLAGHFPNDCFVLKRVDLLPSPVASPLPQPPIVRIVVDDRGCLDRVCLHQFELWSTSVTLPPLPPGDYRLMVQLAQVTCSDSVPPGNYPTTLVPFVVAGPAACSANPCACFLWGWDRSNASGECHTRTSPGHPGNVTFQIQSSGALSGIEGRFNIWPAGLRITQVEAVGPAAGMHLSWTPTSDGARFVMFADQGAPIPASSDPVSVLRLTVELNPGAPLTTYYVNAADLLGSDVNGGAVERCLVRELDVRIADPSARVCTGRDCDFNADGGTDVRDLVLMVHCVNGSGPCPPDPASRFDCDANGRFDLADVICCAMQILRAPGCPDCPVDTVRAEPGIVAKFGSPTPTPAGLSVPLLLGNTWAIGAARIKLRFPADRFRLVGVESAAAIELHEVEGDEVIVGAIGPWAVYDLPPGTSPPGDITLKLELKPGQGVGGEVSVVEGEFSGPDGVMLDVDLGQAQLRLGAPIQLAVSPARPNPSAGETQFSVTLDGEARLDVAIYDVTGRRVAEIFRGTKTAGIHVFTWDGRTAEGLEAREGIYFYRVIGGGRSATGKVALLRGR